MKIYSNNNSKFNAGEEMKTKFTKGEWGIQLAETDMGRDSFEVVTDDYDVCCHRFGIRSEHDVNLIKTAPKMYEMLEYFRENVDMSDQEYDKVTSLLAEARGE